MERTEDYTIINVIFLVFFTVAAECLENLSQIDSIKGIPSQSRSYNNRYQADKAVDGKLQDDVGEETCSFTIGGHNYKEAWWKLPLQKISNVAYLEIYFRRSTVNRHVGFSVFVFNDSSYIPPSNKSQHKVFTHNISTCPDSVTTVGINKEIQGIALYNSKDPPVSTTCAGYESTFATIEICEVKVMGCPSQHYGENCAPCDAMCRERQCDVFNGSCIYGCGDADIEIHDCSKCKDSYYETHCTLMCSYCKNGTLCKKIGGVCPEGCQGIWNNSKCSGCKDGFYGEACEISCGKCIKGTFCDKKTGVCPERCQEHWGGPLCDECEEGFYGKACENTCGRCRNGTYCNASTGICPNGCENHWKEALCKVCLQGFYGPDCEFHCGKCTIGTFCDKITGICPEGCQEHWNGSFCDECKEGFYGRTCEETCGYCRNETYCKTNTGVCPLGCEDNWDGPICKACRDGFYGPACEFNCGKCKNETFCDNITGNCFYGCQDHWNGTLCDECTEGYYGQTCEDTCGHCKNETHCNKTTGVCLSGCEDNWDGPKCEECENGFYGQECEDKCGNCINGTYCDKVNGSCLDGCHGNWNGSKCNVCEDGYYGIKCEYQCSNCLKGSCEQDTGHCVGGCYGGWAGAKCEAIIISSDPNAGGIVGGLLTALAVSAIFVIIVIRILRRQIEQKERGDQEYLSTTVEYKQKSNPEEIGNDNHGGHLSVASPDNILQNSVSNGEYYNTSQVCTFIHVQELYNIIATKSREKNRDFQLEYKRLPRADERKCLTAQRKENVTKNRFKTTFPYEHSRVVLQEKWEENDNDYINANYIKDHKRERRYIGAQAPRNNTLADFIRMIWQENIECIIMLTNLVENGKNKCAKYWPDKGKSLCVGKCTLSHLEETMYAFYTVRMFSFQRKDSNDIRIITQFHYTAWPDHGTPEEIGLVQFHRAVTKRYEPGAPLLVHCSAGVGRTGTFIGLDSLLRQGREKGRINVFDYVKQMREDRMSMVQTLEQYVFLHKALLCGFQEKDTIISEYDLGIKASSLLNDSAPLNQQQLYQDFKFLETIKPVYDDDCREEAMNEENRSKNVDIDIIPVSKYRPFLSSFVEWRNDYINAVIVPSYTAASGLILTQSPLPDTEVDLWRLCMDHRVGAIVILNDSDEVINWLPSRGENRSLPPYLITARKTENNIGGVRQSSLLILRDGDTQSIAVFKVDSRNDDQVIKLAEMVLEKERESNLTSLVISKDGAGPAGIFCVLYNALEQLRMDGEVDIFTIVRQIQTRRPEAINNLEDYRKCYQLVSQSVSTNATYANM